MKVNFDHQFHDENGRPVRFQGQDKAIFKDLAVQALLNGRGNEEGEPNAQQKRHRYDLAVKISNFGSQAEISENDAQLLIAVMGSYHTMVAAQAQYLLEGKEIPTFAPKIKGVQAE